MKRKSISLIIGLMTVALLGVMAMQLYFLRESYRLKAQLFDQNVNEALGNVVAKLEKLDANNFLESKVKKIKHPKIFSSSKYKIVKQKKTVKRNRYWQSEASLLRKEQRKADSIFFIKDSIFMAKNPGALVFNDAVNSEDFANTKYKLNVDIYEYVDALGQLHQQTQQTLSKAFTTPTSNLPRSKGSLKLDSVRQYIVFDPQIGPRLITIPKPQIKSVPRPKYNKENEEAEVTLKQEFLDSVEKKDLFQDLNNEYQQAYVPLRKRISPLFLDSVLRYELNNQAIFSKYEFKVTSAKYDSLIFSRASEQASFLPYNSYHTPLFPKDMIRDAGMLTITFPEKSNFILSNLTAMMSLSGGLLFILIFCFGYTIHSILLQKKLSEMKTDFINNMTHEFKTPVSTIMIASEALKDPELNTDKARITHLAGIIYDENIRLGNHIERVLNIAKIDKGDLTLEYKEIEVNDLLAAIIDSMALQLLKRNAKIELELNAKKAIVLGDELHLSNIIFNLIDNANKYSKTDPEIKITTCNVANKLIIKVADKGIGMNRDQQSKIFDQFYRIPTGNLHDVKGFGLGLSYVSNIVKRLNGSITVKSEKDKGAEFQITLPLAP